MAYALDRDEQQAPDGFSRGIAFAAVLHVVLLVALGAFSLYGHYKKQDWGANEAVQGSIAASMVSAIPLPHETQPVEKQVLAPEVTSPAPEVPKPAAEPPPKPTDIEVKAKTPEKAKVAPTPAPEPPKHPQPTPDIPKAQSGQAATQLMQSTVQVGTGTSTLTVMEQAVGSRYAYYFGIVNRNIGRNWYKSEADPRASIGRKVTITFDIDRDGVPSNVRIETRSGSPTLDQSALHALQRIDTFGPSPAPGTVTVEDTFVFGNAP